MIRSLSPGAVGLRFGSQVWDFDGAVRRRPNLSAPSLRISFDIDDPVWHLRAREVAMISLNRHHEAVEDITLREKADRRGNVAAISSQSTRAR